MWHLINLSLGKNRRLERFWLIEVVGNVNIAEKDLKLVGSLYPIIPNAYIQNMKMSIQTGVSVWLKIAQTMKLTRN